jgi:hypothetical protein
MLDGREKKLFFDTAWGNLDRSHRPRRIHTSTDNTFPSPVDNQHGDEEIPIAKRYHSNFLIEGKSSHPSNWALSLFGAVDHSCLLQDDPFHAYHTISSF